MRIISVAEDVGVAISALHFAVLKVVHVNVYPICSRRSQFCSFKRLSH